MMFKYAAYSRKIEPTFDGDQDYNQKLYWFRK